MKNHLEDQLNNLTLEDSLWLFNCQKSLTYYLAESSHNDSHLSKNLLRLGAKVLGFEQEVISQIKDQSLQGTLSFFSSLKKQKNWGCKEILFIESMINTLTSVQKSHSKKRSIIDEVEKEFMVAVFSRNGHFLKINENFQDLCGYRKSELIGKPFTTINWGHHDSDFFNIMKKTLLRGSSWKGLIKGFSARNKPFWMNGMIIPTFNEERKLVEYFFLGHDVSQQIELENIRSNQAALLDNIFSQNPNCLVLANEGNQIIKISDSFNELFHYEPNEIIGKNIFSLLANSKENISLANNHNMINGDKHLVEYKRADGTLFIGETIGSFVKNHLDEVVGFLGSVRDVTYQLQFEKELSKAKDEAKEQFQTKSNFMACMTHEIRTPLNGILGMLQLLEETTLDHHQSIMINTIRTSSENLLVILNDILDLSRLESGKMILEKETIDIINLLHHIQRLHSPAAKAKGIRLSLQVNTNHKQLFYRGDRACLCQILNNFVSNAIKYTNAGEVSISFDVVSKLDQGDILKFSVTDTGIGISDEERKLLFHPFSQVAHNLTKKHNGTGLGLLICQRLSEMMNGDISFTSQPNKGSEFSFKVTLPTSKPIPIIKTPKMTKTPFHYSFHILIAEDNTINQKVVTRFLDKLGCTYSLVGNGRDALEKIFEEKFDLIFMDIRMPVMDGVEASRLIRDSLGEHCPPILAMTANLMAEDQKSYFEVGITELLPKPIKKGKLIEVLNHFAFNKKIA